MTQAQALTILKTGANVFLTGEPGSGKTHTINQYVSYLRRHGIDPAITASTGIAATHIGGSTIHSWSGVGIRTEMGRNDVKKIVANEYISKRIKKAVVLIIDEISMLAPSTLALVDMVCREARANDLPFGGLQVVFVGDFFQLPPVIKSFGEEKKQTSMLGETMPKFVFETASWREAHPFVCYLTEQHRQEDSDFLSVLNAIRRNEVQDHHVRMISARTVTADALPKDVTKLFSLNVDVDRINEEMLAKLNGEEQAFAMTLNGFPQLAEIIKKSCLSPETLRLKTGAKVIFTKNNPKEGVVNGTLGVVVGYNGLTKFPIVRTNDGRELTVEPAEWSIEDNGKVRASVTQFPLRLAWAITIHKSQGMSLDEAVMDLGSVFEYGQGYVALSRVRKLSGLHLLGWNPQAFRVHPNVLEQDQFFRRDSEQMMTEMRDMLEEDLARRHEHFIRAAGGFVETRGTAQKKAKKISAKAQVLALWREGKNVAQIAEERGVKEQTVFLHVENLIKDGKIPRAELSRLVTPAFARAIPQIHRVFRELDTDKLAVVYQECGEKYSYEELKIARLLLDA